MAFTKIQDVNVPTKGVGKYFSIILLNLELPGTTPSFYWEVRDEFTESSGELDEQVIKIPGNTILNGNLQMTSSEYDQWGTDDQYVIDWALAKLNFSKL